MHISDNMSLTSSS